MNAKTKEVARFLVNSCDIIEIVGNLIDRYIIEIEKLNSSDTLIILKEYIGE